jgi:hypothetical protein
MSYVYFILNEFTKNVKIGHSGDPDTRLRQLQQGNDCPLKLVAIVEGGQTLERQYHETWDQYRIETPTGNDEWFSVDVYPTAEGGVRVIGRKVQKKKKKAPFRHQYCLRLTDDQAELLRRYVAYRGFKSEVDAVRAMIDGLEDWFQRQEARQEAKERAAVTSVTPKQVAANSGPRPITDVPTNDGAIDVDPSVGDFGGLPSVGLPESSHDGQE